VAGPGGRHNRHRRSTPPPDPRIAPGTGRQAGPAITRNLALARSTGDLIRNLDQDDILLPGALARDIAALSTPAVHWATSPALDLLPDGTLVAYDEPRPGHIPPGHLLNLWRTNNQLPVHPTTLCLRRHLILALGGWMALPASEDTALLIAASTVAAGHHTAEPSLLYRKWPGQLTASEAHTDPTEHHLRTALITERAAALTAAQRFLNTKEALSHNGTEP
jgi:hypothetical protein